MASASAHDDASRLRQMPVRPGRAGVAAVKPRASLPATKPRPATCEPKDTGTALLQAALTRENLQRRWKRVRPTRAQRVWTGWTSTQTAATPEDARGRDPRATAGGDVPAQPVRRVDDPQARRWRSASWASRRCTDRLIQQALLQVLQPVLDPHLQRAQLRLPAGTERARRGTGRAAYVHAGKRVVVDVDLEKFFDQVNHDILMPTGRRIADAECCG